MARWDVGNAAARLHADALVWDQHTCLPLRLDADVDDLLRHRDSGADFVSVNVGFDAVPWTECIKVTATFRRRLLERPDWFVPVRTVADVAEAQRSGRLAVAFDLEGTEPLDGEIAMISAFAELGVKTMLIAYNNANRAGGGCHDDAETGLTAYGRDVVAEMNAVGLIVDATHCSRRTSLDLCSVSQTPVIYSHSNPRALRDHERNLVEDQIRACADTGGVVGINGVGIFLGENDARTEAVVRHIEHVAELVGIDHVGLGLDYVFDQDELTYYLKNHPEVFPEGKGYTGWDHYEFVAPEQLPSITAALLDRGHTEEDIRKVLGRNFLRVAMATWAA